MCNNCNCDMYDRCSIVGFMPYGFCCERCVLYDKNLTCLRMQTKRDKKLEINMDEEIRPIKTSIEGGLLKVVIGQKDKEIPIIIDLQKQLESQVGKK